ncbi:hypothetical protein BJV74DRAFT_149688 [Russula compacta]|nr:hypothetical protein BJV74DRAFT_149688 [Russula compacta]
MTSPGYLDRACSLPRRHAPHRDAPRELADARETSGRPVVESVSNIDPHFARTLREWRRRFQDNFVRRSRRY